MLEIRPLRLTDAEAFEVFQQAILADKAINPYTDWVYVPDFPTFVGDNLASEWRRPGQTWSTYSRYFAFLDGELVGLFICFWEADHPTVQELGEIGYLVAPAYRRQGLAQLFLRQAFEDFQQRGRQQVSLVADAGNVPSRALIEKLGGRLVAQPQLTYLGRQILAAKYVVEL